MKTNCPCAACRFSSHSFGAAAPFGISTGGIQPFVCAVAATRSIHARAASGWPARSSAATRSATVSTSSPPAPCNPSSQPTCARRASIASGRAILGK